MRFEKWVKENITDFKFFDKELTNDELKKLFQMKLEQTTSGDVAGSQQTRVVGDKKDITVLKREPRPLNFDYDTGSYSPSGDEED